MRRVFPHSAPYRPFPLIRLPFACVCALSPSPSFSLSPAYYLTSEAAACRKRFGKARQRLQQLQQQLDSILNDISDGGVCVS